MLAADVVLVELTPYDLECAPYYGYKPWDVCVGGINSTAVVCPPAGVAGSGEQAMDMAMGLSLQRLDLYLSPTLQHKRAWLRTWLSKLL